MTELPTYTLDDLEAEPIFVVTQFTADDATKLGTIGLDVIAERGLNLAIDVVLDGHLTYRAMTGTTGPVNDEWLAGKAAVARHYGVPSLMVRRRFEATDGTIADDGLDDTYKAHGGSIPIIVAGAVRGTITMSGEPDVVDHAAAIEALRRFLAG
ncbi:MAG: heme-binding protein [Salinibacterium sp.]|nr:heme-binding protein [Salinibacterium sp.]